MGYAARGSSNAVAIGSQATAYNTGSVAIGNNANAGSGNPGGNIAIGNGASALNTGGGYGTMAIGVAASAGTNGYAGGGAIGFGARSNAANYAIGDGAQALAGGGSAGVAIGNSANSAGVNALAFGRSTLAAGGSSVAIGDGANVGTSATGSIAIGQLSNVVNNAVNSLAFGSNARVSNSSSTAIGADASAAGGFSVALGRLATANNGGALALGGNSTVSANYGVALGGALGSGRGAVVTGTSSVAIGTVSSASAENAVALGSGSVADRAYTVSVGAGSPNQDGRTFTRQIVNVGAGTQQTDAVNVSQLTGVTTALGGGAAVGSDGSVTNPTYKVGGTDYHTVGDALDALAASGSGTDPNAVRYDDSAQGIVTLAGVDGTTLSNVKAGVADMDAVNVSQLKGSGLIGDDGKAIAAVTYDRNADGTPNLGSVTLGGAGATTPVALKNVADGVDRHDAINLGQLQDSGLVAPVDPTNPGAGLTTLAVTYDGVAKDKVTLAGVDGTTLSNVKAGVADMDAVNVSQLKGSGLIGDDGKAIAAVTYDRNADGTPNLGSVTLGGAGATTPVALKNVADGVDRHDAINLGQLQDSGLVAPVDPTNPGAGLTTLAVTYDGVAKDKVTLAGVDGTTLSNVKAGVADMDAVNVNQLKGAGLIGDDGKAIAAVTYDRNADGTPNYGSVTLGGGHSTGPVTLANVAAGIAPTDAVNVQQMQRAVVEGNPYIGGRGTGVAAQATGINAVALGLGSVANEINTISVGNGATGLQRRITNVQNGQADSDAATVGQVNDLIGVASTNTQTSIDDINAKTRVAIQDMNSRLDAINTTASSAPYVQVDGAGDGSDNAFAGAGTFGVAIGAEASATGTTAIAIGAQSVSSGTGSVALGAGASATANGAVAFGSGRATGTSALALGNGTQAAGNNAVAAGFNAQAAGLNALAFGNTSRANATDSMAFGTTAQVDPLATNSIAIGRAANVTSVAQNAVALGSNSVADRLNAVSVGSTGQQRQIIYVARGTANSDAVNVSQLKDAMAAFGGSATVGADGAIVNPTYTIGGATYRNVGDALNALAGLGGGADPLAVTYGTNADGTPNFEVVTLKGASGTTLSNVKAGVADMDAVNVIQLKGSGLIGDDGKSIAAVTYDRNADGTPNYGSVTLGHGAGPTQLKNVADATDDGDALNLGQLKNAGLVGDDSAGNLTSLAVTYDDATKDSVTLGGAGATTPVALHNVADGVLSATSKDAVNGSQLFATNMRVGDLEDSLSKGGVIDPVTGESLAVVYDGTAKNTVTLGGAGATAPVALKNVADGVDRHDAINLGQLQDSGLVAPVDPTNPGAGLTTLAVTYDGVAKDKVTLAGVDGTTLSNVKAGIADMDAVNVSQLKDAGLIDPSTGKPIAAVTYDSAAKDTVTLGGAGATTPVALKNVADAKDDGDALNLGQLKNAGLVGDDGAGNLTSMAVTYDDATKDSVTLGGAGATTPVALHNVADGVLSATSKDAVNGSQLFATNTRVGDLEDSLSKGGVIDPVTGESLAVVYDGTTKDKVTLAGADGTTLSNVKAGIADMDAVNVSQLKGSGLIGDDGKAIAAVTYDRLADGTPNYGSVTLGNGAGPTQIKNVADATDDHDAINFNQLKQYVADNPGGPGNPLAVAYDDSTKGQVTLQGGADGTTITNVKAGEVSATSTDAINGSQLHGTAQSVADALGGGSTVGADGTVTNPSYSLADPTDASKSVAYDNVGDALSNLDGRTSTNTENITVINKQLADSGLVDPVTGQSIAAVTYDRNADGTPNQGSVTLGGAGATAPVALKNVADGVDRHDAINLGQLQDSGLVAPVDPTDPGAGLTTLAVTYDGVAKDTVTLKGADGTTLSNVKAGVADMDAVNVSQLKGSGLIGDDGKSIAAVTYDRNADGTPNLGSVTLGGAGATAPVALKNVANAKDDHDALNLGQLKNAGLVGDDGTGTLTSLAVTYDDATKDSVTLGGAGATTPVALHNVADGVLSATSKDAVNGSQLFATNTRVGDLEDSLSKGGVIDPVTGESLAVVYDGAAKNTVTLGGAGATAPVALKNVANAKDDHDALNLGQLKNAGLVGDDGAGNLTSMAVTYDGAARDKVTLAGADGTMLSNVKAGVADMDAVNVSQLKGSGLIGDDGKAIAAVTYDRNADGTPNLGSVTLGGAGATTPVALKNVADGTNRHDAINLGQLQDAGLVAPVDPTNPGEGLKSLVVAYDSVAQDVVTLKGADGTTLTNVKAGAVTATSTDAVNGAQLHGTAQSVADALGGGSTVGADGTVTNPTYSLADPADASKSVAYDNVGDALSNLDGRTTTNTENITVINKQLADSGLVDPVTGQSIAAVTYDRNADGTPNLGSVTLGGAGATAPVALKNVADGVDTHDAVNVGQLQNAGLVAPVDPTNPGAGLKSLAVAYDSVAQDTVTLKGANGTTITNVKAGAVTASSTDAVNGSQLYGASKNVAHALGGGATVDANGNLTNPSYTVNNQTFDNVGDAIENISNSLVHGSIGLVQQDEDTRDITVAKDTDGTTVNFAGTAGDRVLTGVAAGAVSATSNDAINGSQLHGTAQSVADVIGGGTTVDADGKLADTAIDVNGSKYKTVAEAVQAAAAYGATDSLAVRYDLNGDGTPNYGSVTLGGTGAAPVRLTNVADGASQYDAVNYGQLSDLADKVGGLDDRVGKLELNPGNPDPGGGSGGSDYFTGTDVGTGTTTPADAGSGTGNTAAGSGASIGTGANNATVIGSNAGASQSNGVAIGSGAKSAAEGATAIGSGSNASGSQSVAIGQGANASGSNSVALGAGSTAYGDDTVSVGSIDRTRTISNVSDGVNATDVATKGQLDRAMGGVQGQMNELSRNAYSGIAAATALTMIPGVDPGKTVSFGIGGATYKGYQAVAFGGEARITQNLKMKAGVGMSSGGNTVGVGASYQW
ncbi:YadA-like family protein [Burkholderia cenocepacia]|uniref:YadA-like family protein n=1 Tax=Burkholderia cenocepacia TaxID=95486 RepID=UPI003D769B2C